MLYYGDISSFSLNYCAVVTKMYWTFKKEEILNLTIFDLLSFW